MLLYRQPEALENLMCIKVARLIVSAPRVYNSKPEEVETVRQLLRPYLTCLPTIVRSSVMNEALYEWRIQQERIMILFQNPIALHIIEIFIDEETEYLSFCGSFRLETVHMNRLLNIIAGHSKNLKFLELYGGSLIDIVFLKSCRNCEAAPLRAIVMNNKHLQHLSIPQICTDEILKIVGDSCYQLRVLDVSMSDVTDEGICGLIQLACSSDAPITVDDDPRDITYKVQQFENTSFYFPPAIRSVLEFSDETQEMDQSYSYVRQKTALCKTLVQLTLFETKVTRIGILFALGLVDNLQSLGNYAMNDVVDTLAKLDKDKLPKFKLCHVYLSTVTNTRLHTLSLVCPALKFMKYNKSGEVLPDLRCLNALTSLEIMNRINDPNVNNAIEDAGPHIEKLLLLYGEEATFNLCPVMKNCPKLTELSIVCKRLEWNDPRTYSNLRHLTRLALTFQVTGNATKNVLRMSPNLVFVYFHEIVEASDDFLMELCDIPISEKLTTFYIKKGSSFENKANVSHFLHRHLHIRKVGKLDCGVKDLGFEENVDLTIVGHPVMFNAEHHIISHSITIFHN